MRPENKPQQPSAVTGCDGAARRHHIMGMNTDTPSYTSYHYFFGYFGYRYFWGFFA